MVSIVDERQDPQFQSCTRQSDYLAQSWQQTGSFPPF
jgi:hypothetical protein